MTPYFVNYLSVTFAFVLNVKFMENRFEIIFVSDANKEFLIAEIQFNKQRLCQINREKGEEDMEIEFLDDIYVLAQKVNMKFSLAEFETTLKEAKNDLKSCLKLPD